MQEGLRQHFEVRQTLFGIFKEFFIVDDRRIAFRGIHMDFNAEILSDLFAERIKTIAPHLEGRLAENAQRSFKMCMRSNGVAHCAGLQQTKLQRAPGAFRTGR